MNTPITAKEAANALWEISREQGYGNVSPMKLQKLVYYAHGWHLAYSGKPLISEGIQAWDYGPVIESLYHDLKVWGSGEMTSPIVDVNFKDMQFYTETPTVPPSDLRSFLGNVVKVYGPLTAIQLSNMTHMPGTPWARLKEKFPLTRSLTIPNELIREFFVAQLPAATVAQ